MKKIIPAAVLAMALAACDFMGGGPTEEQVEQRRAARERTIKDSCMVIARHAYCWPADDGWRCQSTLVLGQGLHEIPVDSAVAEAYREKDIYQPCADSIRASF